MKTSMESILNSHHITSGDELEPPLSSEEIQVVMRTVCTDLDDPRPRRQIAHDMVVSHLLAMASVELQQPAPLDPPAM